MTIEAGKVWLTINELSQGLSVDDVKSLRNTIDIGCRRNNGKAWINRPFITPTSKIQIDLDSIPAQTKIKYRIPAKEYFIQQEAEARKAEAIWNQQQVEAARAGLFSDAIAIDPEIHAWYLNRLKGLQFAKRETFKTVTRDYPILASLMIEPRGLRNEPS